MPPPPARIVVFIAGAFVTSAYWQAWEAYFTSCGYTCYAPAWPHKEASAAEQRRQHPHAPVAATGLADVLAAYAAFIGRLPAPPILIGHSYGGLLVQLLLQQGIAAAGVAIESVPPFGVWTWS